VWTVYTTSRLQLAVDGVLAMHICPVYCVQSFDYKQPDLYAEKEAMLTVIFRVPRCYTCAAIMFTVSEMNNRAMSHLHVPSLLRVKVHLRVGRTDGRPSLRSSLKRMNERRDGRKDASLRRPSVRPFGLTENAGHEIAGHEIAGHENAGHGFARQDKYRMKIDYITLECAFLFNFKSFICKASVLTCKILNCACSS